jgi:glycosyltransferase involved in cell wall biosynthesis
MHNMSASYRYSFIIPVYNSGEYLPACLDSVANQSYPLNAIEMIIIDDCSTDSETLALISSLKKDKQYKGIDMQVLSNEKNEWSAKTRNKAAALAKGTYLVCLDSDDLIEPSFLNYSDMAFAAYPFAAWTYPSVRKFGYKNQVDIAPDFNAIKLFLSNYQVVTSPVSRALWNKLGGQKSGNINRNVKLFEDWDFWQRAVGVGAYGAPMKKVLFHYRQGIKSNISRTEEEGNLTTLLSYRKNAWALLGARKAQESFKKWNEQFILNYGVFSRIIRKLSKKLTGRYPGSMGIKELILFVFAPSLFIKNKLQSGEKLTKAHKMAGFKKGFTPELSFDASLKEASPSPKVLCTHFWWHIGGAENILLDYMRELKDEGFEIWDVVIDSEGPAKALKAKFAEVAHTQYALDEVANGPYPRLLALWHLIQKAQPTIILNMSNPLLYLLTPLIKKHLPHTLVYDLLHCEEFDDNGWFEAAYHFQEHVDIRIVTSDFWKEVLIKKYNERADKIKVIYNMIDYDAFKNEPKNREEKLAQYGIPKHKKIVGFLGRLHEQKRPEIFLALAEKMANHADFHFVLAGDGPLLESLKPLIKNLTNLTYIGPTKRPETVFTFFDVAIFPSKFEGYPLVGIECAQIGLPIIAANIVGFNEILHNGNSGIGYDVRSAEEDPESIKDILLNRWDELQKLGQNGPAFVEKFHNKTQIKADIRRTFVATS